MPQPTELDHAVGLRSARNLDAGPAGPATPGCYVRPVEKLRLFRLWLGALFVAVWAGLCLFLLVAFLDVECAGNYRPDCGDARRTPFLMGVVVSPLLLAGLPLLASGLPPRDPSADGGAGRFRVFLQVASVAIAAVFALCATVFVADLGAGAGAELLFVPLAGCAAASVWAGVRAGR